ncbi:hypothetical protein SUGI_0695590 [Cryptomeria japonica]|nr:hypothetical protein SUGI_0695590 [Cryptomeria japonica]
MIPPLTVKYNSIECSVQLIQLEYYEFNPAVTLILSIEQFVDDGALFWGIKYSNDVLLQAGEMGSVQSDILMQKITGKFTFNNGWGFPHRVYFNGDECMLPPPNVYPWLPRTTTTQRLLSGPAFIATILIGALFFIYFYWACTMQRQKPSF